MNNDHLGGHGNKTWVDEGALVWAKKQLGVSSVLDIGCGPGGMRDVCKRHGIFWRGIDGDPTLDLHDYILCDFSKQGFNMSLHCDLAWSVEFLEHVEERYMDNYMSAFTKCKYVIATAAPPGWKGHHHVNEQLLDYWIAAFQRYNFIFDEKMTVDMRKHSTMKKKRGSSFMQRTGMVYIKDIDLY